MAESLVVSEAVYTAEDGLDQPSAHQRQATVEAYAHMAPVRSHEWCTTRTTHRPPPPRGLLRG